MIDDLSAAAAKLLLSILYRESATVGRRQRQRALHELEDGGWIRLMRRPPKPALIELLRCPPGLRPTSDLIRSDETSEMIYSNLSNRSTRLAPSEHDLPEQLAPGLEPLQGPISTQFTGSANDAVTGSETDAASKSEPVTGSANDAGSVFDAVTGSVSDAVEAADRMPVNEAEGFNVGSSFWRRRQQQLYVLGYAWGDLFPKATLVTQEQAKKYLRITGDQAMPVYEMMLRASKAKKPIEYPATYIERALEREKQQQPPRSSAQFPAKADVADEYYKPFDGELEEVTPEELEERRKWAEQIKELRRKREAR